MSRVHLILQTDGSVRCVYTEQVELAALGDLQITRASHVEPEPDGNWSADLSPVGGPVLGPFARRSQALEAEQDWLHAHWLGQSSEQLS